MDCERISVLSDKIRDIDFQIFGPEPLSMDQTESMLGLRFVESYDVDYDTYFLYDIVDKEKLFLNRIKYGF